MGLSIMEFSSDVRISKSHVRVSIEISAERAEVCKTAVKNPVGNVKADNQNKMGGLTVSAHTLKCSIRRPRSLVHEPRSFNEG